MMNKNDIMDKDMSELKEKETTNKLVKFDKYLLNLKSQIPFDVKKKIRWRLREMFYEELKDTEIGRKWKREVLEK